MRIKIEMVGAVLGWLFALAFVAAGQAAEPRVSAQLSAGVARQGEQVNIIITVEDATSARVLTVPKVEGLSVGRAQGPTRREFTQIVNGRRSHQLELVWSVPVRGEALGDYEIPPIVLEVGGASMRTRPLHLKVVRDIRGEDLGFLEITPSSTKVVEGQPFTLELRFGWERSSNSNFASLSLPWWGALPGALELDQAPLPPNSKLVEGILVNDRVEVVVEELPPEGGRRIFRLTKSFLPSRSGNLEFPTSFFEFGVIQRNRSLLFRSQDKVTSYFVRAQPFTLEVIPLPTKGQPFDYGGAVGTFTVGASADTRDVVVGDSIKLTVDWTGSGNLEFFDPPDLGRLSAFDGFRVYGTTEEKSFDRRRVIYDVAPLTEEVDLVPAVPLVVFDPEREKYTTVASDPIPIRVRPLERPASLAEADTERFEIDVFDIDARPLSGAAAGAGGPTDGTVVLALVLVPVLWLGLRVGVRRRLGDPSAPLERRRRRARRRLVRALARDDDPRAVLSAFAAYLAARTREPDEAWIGRDLRRWAGENGRLLSNVEAEGAAELFERLERAAYGQGARVAGDEVLSAADRLRRAGL